jgi:hypothetical protein
MKAGRSEASTLGNDDCMILLLLMYTIFVLPMISGKNVKTFVTGKMRNVAMASSQEYGGIRERMTRMRIERRNK